MKLHTRLRGIAPAVRTRRELAVPQLTDLTLPVVAAAVLAASALLTGATAAVAEAATVPALVATWAATLALPIALVVVSVRGVVAVLERVE